MLDWLQGRQFGILVTAACPIGAILLAVINWRNIWTRWPDPQHIASAIVPIIAATVSIGLYLRKKWARWLGMVWMIGILSYTYSVGIPLTGGVVLFVAVACGIWWFWDMPITVDEEFPSKEL